MTTMPMFPLGTVLLPGAVLPLHVFEPRYRKLVQDCLEGEPEFGVVLIERGSEVGGGDVRGQVGSVARIIQIAELDDGRYAMVTVGTRRIMIHRWLPDDPYPIADVEDWIDATPTFALDVQLERIESRIKAVLALAVELGDSSSFDPPEVSDDPTLASYHLSALAPLGSSDQQRLLVAPSVESRLDLLAAMLDDVEAMMQFRLGSEPAGDA